MLAGASGALETSILVVKSILPHWNNMKSCRIFKRLSSVRETRFAPINLAEYVDLEYH